MWSVKSLYHWVEIAISYLHSWIKKVFYPMCGIICGMCGKIWHIYCWNKRRYPFLTFSIKIIFRVVENCNLLVPKVNPRIFCLWPQGGHLDKRYMSPKISCIHQLILFSQTFDNYICYESPQSTDTAVKASTIDDDGDIYAGDPVVSSFFSTCCPELVPSPVQHRRDLHDTDPTFSTLDKYWYWTKNWKPLVWVMIKIQQACQATSLEKQALKLC